MGPDAGVAARQHAEWTTTWQNAEAAMTRCLQVGLEAVEFQAATEAAALDLDLVALEGQMPDQAGVTRPVWDALLGLRQIIEGMGDNHPCRLLEQLAKVWPALAAVDSHLARLQDQNRAAFTSGEEQLKIKTQERLEETAAKMIVSEQSTPGISCVGDSTVDGRITQHFKRNFVEGGCPSFTMVECEMAQDAKPKGCVNILRPFLESETMFQASAPCGEMYQVDAEKRMRPNQSQSATSDGAVNVSPQQAAQRMLPGHTEATHPKEVYGDVVQYDFERRRPSFISPSSVPNVLGLSLVDARRNSEPILLIAAKGKESLSEREHPLHSGSNRMLHDIACGVSKQISPGVILRTMGSNRPDTSDAQTENVGHPLRQGVVDKIEQQENMQAANWDESQQRSSSRQSTASMGSVGDLMSDSVSTSEGVDTPAKMCMNSSHKPFEEEPGKSRARRQSFECSDPETICHDGALGFSRQISPGVILRTRF